MYRHQVTTKGLVMDDYYVDDWGEIQKKTRLSDWSEFEPWEYWVTQYEWIDASAEIIEHDMIAFRDDVIQEFSDGSRSFKDGVRFIIARVANISEGKAYLEIVHSEGEEAYSQNEHIYRSIKWLAKYGVQRWPRDHSPTDGVTPEQRERGEIIKEKREASASGNGKNSGKRNYRIAFNNYTKKKAKRLGSSSAFTNHVTGKGKPPKPKR